MNEEQNKICVSALVKYGSQNQTDMMIEECSELIKALCKYKRSENDVTLHNVQEEIADVLIMAHQMQQLYGPETVEKIKENKLLRLKYKIDSYSAEFVECWDNSANPGFDTGRIYPVAGIHEAGYAVIDPVIKSLVVYGHGFFKPSTKEEYDRQCLMDKAIKTYNPGTRIIGVCWRVADTIAENPCISWGTNNNIICQVIESCPAAENEFSTCLYYNGEWAEIIKATEKP